MRRLISISVLALVALASLVATASASTTPVITSFSPAQVRVGQTLVINGKNFRKGVKNNRVFFIRATDGKTVRTRPSKASSSRRMEVVVPAGVTTFLTLTNGVPSATRFELQVLSGKFSKKTPKTRSPIVLPASAPDGTGGGGVGTTPPPPADCDGDGTPDATDNDDDNDGLSDTTEAAIHTDPCKKDTDGDGVGDAYEYYAALDLNGVPDFAGKRPYPNPLDSTDANKDFDGDGMTMTEEYAASVAFGTAISAPLTYSDGNQTSAAPNNSGAMDLDENGRITDEEKDADNDGLPNWIEMAKGETDPLAVAQSGCQYVDSTHASNYDVYKNIFTDCGAGRMPNGNTFTGLKSGKTITGAVAPPYDTTNTLNYLDADSDGDGIPDGIDDQDFDGFSNLEEITAGTDGYFTSPHDPCDPNPDSRTCPTHASHQ